MNPKWGPAVLMALSVMAQTLLASDAATQPAPSDPVASRAWGLLSDGKQADAEAVLLGHLDAHPDDADNLFLIGVLTRSGFESETAGVFFKKVIQLEPGSDNAVAARAVLDLDQQVDPQAPFAALRGLVKAHPENAAFDWLLAVECRNYNRNEEGVRAYEVLGKHFKTGPSLFHQTYANLLDELGRSEEALPHRKLAVQLEPASWSFGGLAHTYVQLGRPADAADAYDQWLKLQPGNVAAWRGLATQRLLAKQPDKAVDAAHHWVDLQPKSAAAYALLGRSLAADRKISEAADAYKQAATVEPSNDNYASTAILLLHKAGRSAEADQLRAARDSGS
ncbi:MAG: tetratricopeptide repeat protein [Tepidisphaeraceae bacterium]